MFVNEHEARPSGESRTTRAVQWTIKEVRWRGPFELECIIAVDREDLGSRVDRLRRSLTLFSAELHLAYQYIRFDPASSLTKSRMILEKLVVWMYRTEMGKEPRKPLLGDILADNQFSRRIERRILSRMNAIRDLGNLGPHGENVVASDASHVVEDLCEVLDWHLCRETVSHDNEQAEPRDSPGMPTTRGEQAPDDGRPEPIDSPRASGQVPVNADRWNYLELQEQLRSSLSPFLTTSSDSSQAEALAQLARRTGSFDCR